MMLSDRVTSQASESTEGVVPSGFKAEIAEAIPGLVDRDHFLLRIARQVAAVTDNAWVAIYTRVGHNGDMLLRATTMPNSRPLPARISSDPARMTSDVIAYSGVDPAGGLILATPIQIEDALLGALVLYSSNLQRLSSSDQALLVQIAREIGPAVSVAEEHHAIKQSSVRDLTTGANTAWFINQRFDEEIARAQRSLSPVTVIIASVLGFDEYQRSAGFPAADQLLRALTAEYTGLTRMFDVVGVRGRAEFTILLPDTDLSQAGTVITRVHQRSAKVIERLDVPIGSIPVHVVTGAASFPADGVEGTTILVAAEHRFNQNEILHQRMLERG